jgi:hypothetical protein
MEIATAPVNSLPISLPGPAPTDDAQYGIAQNEKSLADPKSSPEIRPVYLSWLLHLIGDLHQPLHCASLLPERLTS